MLMSVHSIQSVYFGVSRLYFFVRTVYQLWLHSNMCMHCRVNRTHQDFQSRGCLVHTICHDLWTVLPVGVGGALLRLELALVFLEEERVMQQSVA